MKKLLCLLPLMACGDDGGFIPVDAPPGDDSQVTPDAPIDAPTTGTVTVTIRDEGAPVEGIDVFFQNPDGSLAGKVPTNASGVASTTMDTGGSVTVLNPFQPATPAFGRPPNTLKTWLGVKPGDQLVIDEGGSDSSVTMIVTLPANSSVSYAELYATCGNDYIEGTEDIVSLYGCGATTDLVVIAYDEAEAPLGYFYKPGVTLVDEGELDLSAETYAAVPDATYTLSGFPAEITDVYADNGLLTSLGQLVETSFDTELTAGGATVMEPRPLVTPTTSVLELELDPPQQLGYHMLVSWQPTAATQTFDATGKLLPTFTAGPTYDAATRQVSWTMAGTGQPDFVQFAFYANRSEPASLSWEWQVVAPYGTSLTLPDVPTELAEFVPLADDNFNPDTLGAIRMPGGYDAARPLIFASNDGPPVTGTSGDISAVLWYEPRLAVARTNRASSWKGLFPTSLKAKAEQRTKAKAAFKAERAAKAKAKSSKLTKRTR